MTPVVGRARTHEQMWEDDIQAGDFSINVQGTYILCVCPCGCASMMNLPIRLAGTPKTSHVNASGASWEWNSNRERPTITPSIRDLGNCRFHGFLTDGTWTFCDDSGVK